MIEHVPTVTIVMSKPAMVQILVSVEVNDTLSPDDAVGVTVNGAAAHERPAGVANVMVWLAFTTEINWLVLVSAPDE